MESAFQVRLVKAGKGHISVHGDKQRVEVLGVVVLVFKASHGFPRRGDRGSEIHADLIFAAMHGIDRQLQMTVVHFCGNRDAVDDQVRGGSIPEVEQKGAGKTGMKLQVLMAGDRWSMRSERKAKMVAKV